MSRSIRVLYVGSDRDDAESVAAGLESERDCLEVVTEPTVAAARERLPVTGFDCVVSAYRTDDGDGLELLRSVREQHPELPFVLFAAEGSEAVASEAIAAGVTDYVRRRPDADDGDLLANRITAAVAARRGGEGVDERIQALEAILENVPLVLCTVDQSGTVTRLRGSAAGALEDDPGTDDEPTLPERFAEDPAVVEGYGRALDGTASSTVVELRDRVFEAWFQPLRSGDDGVTGAVVLAIDVTERRERELELERQNKHLERVASVISHDLRSPLQIAQGHLQAAEETGDANSFKRTREAHDRIEAIIEDVLTLARMGRTISGTTRVELDDVAREAWKTVDTSSITLVVDGNCEMDAEPDRLRQLFENLFRNSVEHGSTGPPSDAREDSEEHGSTSSAPEDRDVTVTVGSIEILPTSTRSTSDTCRGFYVADDGPGIPEDQRADVLEWGFSTRPDGTGFGLAIVEQIAEAHGWDVEVTRSYRGGARFEFTGPGFRQVD